MKKLILSGLLLASSVFVFAQKVDTAASKSKINGDNELKLNLIYTVAGFPELNYERIIKDDMSVGIAVLVGIEKSAEYSFGVIPNYRIYFGGKKANGFFIEGNAAIISNRDEYYDYSSLAYTSYPPGYNPTFNPISKTYTNFGLGAAAGAKFLTKNGFVGEIYLGVGRLFGSTTIDAYARSGITIGKRF
ncbi:hypothetical protein [Pedobacter frigiditerrae]|uniref:hypothetical protein n=1 Tax=Pedobacter frigiditerrae TaxID=2530452 RepID=UPI00292CD0B6|nr:hypothetical protein [Pedobacter frigiditerrae]